MQETYTLLRHFADSWFLILMFAFFLGACLWAFRPGSRAVHDDAALAPFRHEDRPAGPSHPGQTDRPAGPSLAAEAEK